MLNSKVFKKCIVQISFIWNICAANTLLQSNGTGTDLPNICNVTFLEKHFVEARQPLNDSVVSQMWDTCSAYFPYCRSSAYPFLAYGAPNPEHISIGIIGRQTQDQRCWGYYLNVKNQDNDEVLSKYYRYGEEDMYGITKHTLNFTSKYFNNTFTCKVVEIPSGLHMHHFYQLPGNQCQKTVSYKLTEYFWEHFHKNTCQMHYETSNLHYVAKSFCDHFNDPDDDVFIATRLAEYIDMISCHLVFLKPPQIIAAESENQTSTKEIIIAAVFGGAIFAIIAMTISFCLCRKCIVTKLLRLEQSNDNNGNEKLMKSAQV